MTMSRPQLPKPARRKTVGFFVASAQRKLPSFYAHMFIEDVNNGIVLPNLGIDDEKPKKIEITGEADEVAIATGLCASIARGRSHSAGSMARSAIETIALHLAWYGKVLFEIVEMGERKQILEMVPDRHLFKPPFAILQFVPKAERSQSRGQRWIVLPRSHTWGVCMPAALGGPKMYRKLLKQLEVVSPPTPEFWSQDLQEGQWNTEFQFDEYKRWQHLAVAKLTRRWGWDGRGIARNFETEFFHFYRGLRFRHAQAVLRQHIVSEINQLFTRLDTRAELRLEGYPTPSDIDRLITFAASGELSYVEAYRQSA
jgi:hypothetical protein